MELRSHKPLQRIWLRASVVGSLWASVEIILGSFFHNLGLPFSGAILSFIGVWIVIAFFQIWKENGLIWRAGLICALMKAISPSAIILGPMIGIFTEAVILEFFIFIFGKNLAGYMVGGALAVFSTLVHKLLNLLITYGFDFFRILVAFYHFAVKQLNLEDLRPGILIGVVVLVYILAGMTAAVSGFRSGRKYLLRQDGNQAEFDLLMESNLKWQATDSRFTFSIFYLFLNIISVVLCLVLLNLGFVWASLSASVLFIGFSLYRYRSTLKRLKSISVWLQFLIITISAALLWKGVSEGVFFSLDGIYAGLRMTYRAILVIIGFSAISIELRNPLIKSILYNKGFASMYQSLSLSFSALPGILSSLPKPEKKSLRIHFPLAELFSKAENLLTTFEKSQSQQRDIIIIKGDTGEGKTTFTGKIIEHLRKNNKRVSGFLAIGVHEEGKRIGFDLQDISTSDQFRLCRTTMQEGWMKTGIYFFDPDGISRGEAILAKAALGNNDLIVIDEIGPMEMNDQVWAKSVKLLCQSSDVLQLWVVRRNLVDIVIRKWNTGTIWIFDISEDNPQNIARKIEEMISSRSSA